MITTIYPQKITKRDGKSVNFSKQKIITAITKALMQTDVFSVKKDAEFESERLTDIVMDLLSKQDNKNLVVEDIQDVVEQVLMAAGYYKTAKHYILYRQQHSQDRKAKYQVGVVDDLNLTLNQVKVLESRYLRHDDQGKTVETPKQLFQRVARGIAANEKQDQAKWQKKFYKMMTNFEFVPAGCYLRSVGAVDKPMLANCFVLPIEDDMAGIFNSVKWMALVQQKGGGTGFNFSKLRPKGDYVLSSGGFSSGPISFMKVFDAATRQVMQGGFKRGANMGILNIDHPDILDFITCKIEEDEITNFNISVGITDDFMRAVENDQDWQLKNPRNGEVVQTVNARNLFNQIVTLAWRTGDPGMIFLDEINRHNPLLETYGPMLATNPCGEQPLHPFDVCNLGSLNLAKFVKDGQILWQKLEEIVRLAVRFLDNGVDVSSYPIKKIEETAKANRRIGMGVMGWADMLYALNISYNSDDAVALAEKVMHFIYDISHDQSRLLAIEKGPFPRYKQSDFYKRNYLQRNLAITTIAPTGTISMVAETSSGIEPIFALAYVKNVVSQNGLNYVNPYFEKALARTIKDEKLRGEILKEVIDAGSCQHIKELPQEIKNVFVTAHDVSWDYHVKMQAAFQRYTDNSVSKTINFPNQATIEEVRNAYLLSWRLGCKGITIYRDGSKQFQILKVNKSAKGYSVKHNHKDGDEQKSPVIQSTTQIKPLKHRKEELLQKVNGYKTKKLDQSQTEVCPECGASLQMTEGCMTCYSCGWSKCSL